MDSSPIVLSNGRLDVHIAPEIGRIVHFGRCGGRNLLWMNPESLDAADLGKGAWLNFGGDKVWTSHQAGWPISMGRGWPPDESTDGRPYRVIERSDNHVVMESDVSEYFKVQLRREISLADESRLTIRNTITRVAANPFAVHIWSVTQTHIPQMCLLSISPRQPLAKNHIILARPAGQVPTLQSVCDGTVLHVPRLPADTKVATLGTWVAGVFDDCILCQRIDYDPAGCYPDASNVQFYHGDSYVELETLSPCVQLRPGESLSNIVEWQLMRRPTVASPEELGRLVGRAAD